MIFSKQKKPASAGYDKSEKIPGIRSSICTGERVAGFKALSNGKFDELILIRDDRDLQKFLHTYQIEEKEIKREW